MKQDEASLRSLVLLPLAHADAEIFFDFAQLREVYHRMRLSYSYERADEIVIDEPFGDYRWSGGWSSLLPAFLGDFSFHAMYRDLFAPDLSRRTTTLRRVRSAWRLVGQSDVDESTRFRLNRMFGLLVMTGRRLIASVAGPAYALLAELQTLRRHALSVLTLAAPNPPTVAFAARHQAVEVAV